VATADGDGWSRGPGGQRRWGRFGAAGLLLRAPGERGPLVLLQHRAFWSHHGGTWGLPGGARDSHETTEQAALREAAEEAGIDAGHVVVRAERLTSAVLNGWSYTTVIADARWPLNTRRNGESAELSWVDEGAVDALPLHPGFAASWPSLRARPMRLLLASSATITGATTFPRTVELPDGDFAWVGHPEVGVDLTTVRQAESLAGFVVITADPGLRARLHPAVPSLDPAALLR